MPGRSRGSGPSSRHRAANECGNVVSVTDVATKASERPKSDTTDANGAGVTVVAVTKALSDFVAALVRASPGNC